MSTGPGDGIDRGLRTGEQFQHFVFWAVTRHPPEKFTDEQVLAILQSEFPHRTDRKRWQNKKERTFQGINLHRTYARNRKKLGVRSEEHAKEILRRIDRKLKGQAAAAKATRPPEELDPKKKYIEGATKQVVVNSYERKPGARKACLRHFGYKCAACGQTMADIYGEVGEGVIHVHHERELSRLGPDYKLDPIEDLKPVCPNCHAILHAPKGAAMSISKLRQILAEVRERKAH